MCACLVLSCGCELLVDDGTRTLAAPRPDASDPVDAGVTRDAPEPTFDSDTGGPTQDGGPGPDVQIADAAHAPDATEPLDAMDASCGQSCASVAATCGQACVDAQSACESACKGNSNGCMNKCVMGEQGCARTCEMQCMACFMGEACPMPGGPWSCAAN
jgi:hypothetical protein